MPDKAVLMLAQKLYEQCQTVKPRWDQLSHLGPCQMVWIERAEKLLTE
jgi:hypothetical protein